MDQKTIIIDLHLSLVAIVTVNDLNHFIDDKPEFHTLKNICFTTND
jgi:hypothetical protein